MLQEKLVAFFTAIKTVSNVYICEDSFDIMHIIINGAHAMFPKTT